MLAEQMDNRFAGPVRQPSPLKQARATFANRAAYITMLARREIPHFRGTERRRCGDGAERLLDALADQKTAVLLVGAVDMVD